MQNGHLEGPHKHKHGLLKSICDALLSEPAVRGGSIHTMTLDNVIPAGSKRGLLATIEPRLKSHGFDVGVLHKPTLAPLANAEQSARRFQGKAITNIR
jgi:hypothetical protein